MKLIGDEECYSKMPHAQYGYDAYGNLISPPTGCQIVPRGDKLREGDFPFDVYGGWWKKQNKFNAKYHTQAISDGRWTTWAREIKV